MVKVVEDDDIRQLAYTGTLTLVRDVGEVLSQLFARLVVYVECCNGACCQLLARPEEHSLGCNIDNITFLLMFL